MMLYPIGAGSVRTVVPNDNTLYTFQNIRTNLAKFQIAVVKNS